MPEVLIIEDKIQLFLQLSGDDTAIPPALGWFNARVQHMIEKLQTNNLRRLSGFRASIVFFKHVLGLIDFIWPVFLMLILVIALLGLITGVREGWNIVDSLYYAFITALTIGYGDFSPSYPLTKIIAIVIGLFGFLFTGVLVAIAVESVRCTLQGKMPLQKIEK
jgi:hypothetical protein